VIKSFFFEAVPEIPKSTGLVFVLVVMVLTVAMAGRIDPANDEYADWDLHEYIEMAEASPKISQEIQSPFGRRVLGPWLVGVVPGDVSTNFYWLTLIAGSLVAIYLYLLILQSGVPPWAAATAVSLFELNRHIFGRQIWNYYHLNDILALLAVVIAFRYMYRKNWIVFGSAVLIGSMTREYGMLPILVLAAFMVRNASTRAEWTKYALAVAPAVVVFITLFLTVNSVGGLETVEALKLYAHDWIDPAEWVSLSVIPFVPFVALPVIYWRSTKEYFRTHPEQLLFLLLLVLSTSFGSNKARYMAPSFVVVFPLIAVLLKDYCRSRLTIAGLIFSGILSAWWSWSRTESIVGLPLNQVLFLSGLGLATAMILLNWRAGYEGTSE